MNTHANCGTSCESLPLPAPAPLPPCWHGPTCRGKWEAGSAPRPQPSSAAAPRLCRSRGTPCPPPPACPRTACTAVSVLTACRAHARRQHPGLCMQPNVLQDCRPFLHAVGDNHISIEGTSVTAAVPCNNCNVSWLSYKGVIGGQNICVDGSRRGPD